MTRQHVVIGVLGLLGVHSMASAFMLEVPSAATPTIQSAIFLSENGDQVSVAPGTYNEAIDFLGRAITVRSVGGADVTIIDATGLGTSAVTCDSFEGSDSVLVGFTITGGSSDLGGGMRNSNGSPTVRDCKFVDNTASSRGGGMYNVGDAAVINCEFIGNSAGVGGGMYNTCVVAKGGQTCSSSPTVSNCMFDGNTATSGGGMANFNSSPIVSNCAFSENATVGVGGGMLNNSGDPVVTNCTFNGNMCQFGTGGAISNAVNASPIVTGCILWDNSPNEITTIEMITVTYSDVQGSWPGEGNIDADPSFTDDLDLSPGSPCIDAGDNTALPVAATIDLAGNPRFVEDPDTPDTGLGGPPVVDMGAFELQVFVAPSCPADLTGDGDVGFADLLVIITAWGPCPGCPEDLDDDDIVGFGDLLVVLTAWGPCR